MRAIAILVVIIATINTLLSFHLGYEYLFGGGIGMHPLAALAITAISWGLGAFAIWLYHTGHIEHCTELTWPELPKA